jgi:hypothetical protein
MEFNKNWTKEDNKKLRNLISEGKNPNEIRDFFGNDKLFYHPNKKYYNSGKISSLPTFKEKVRDFKTDFHYDFSHSKYFRDEFDYNYKFQTNSGNRYIVDFIYLKDVIGPYRDRDIYNISFTLESREYESEDRLDDNSELIKRIIFILIDFNKRFGKNCIYLIGKTDNLIKDSFENYKEVISISSFTNGLDGYYYEINI